MLTSWFRTKYPWAVMGGLAASAPFGFVGTSEYDPYAFMDACEHTYRAADGACPDVVAAAFKAMHKSGGSSAGRRQLSRDFSLCNELQSEAEANALLEYAQSALVDMSMLDYPYAADYGINFPAWPVNATCSLLTANSNDAQLAMGKALTVFYNATGTRTCLDPARDVPDFGKGDGWPYLACTEMYFPMGQVRRARNRPMPCSLRLRDSAACGTRTRRPTSTRLPKAA